MTESNGKLKMKINLHTHTTESDGHATPNEAGALYRVGGYDAIAVTDHWEYRVAGKRADSSHFADACAAGGHPFLLLASDDTHYYDGDEQRGFIVIDAEGKYAWSNYILL